MSEGRRPSRLRLLAPLRYLSIRHPEKDWYDVPLPFLVGLGAWLTYLFVFPNLAFFGEGGLFAFARELLIMGVPFMVGALAAVSMGAPGPHLDRRPLGAELILDGRALNLRQFLCYQLGYLSFMGLATLAVVVGADLIKDTVQSWISGLPLAIFLSHAIGSMVIFQLFSFLTITVLWSLYFFTDVANRAT